VALIKHPIGSRAGGVNDSPFCAKRHVVGTNPHPNAYQCWKRTGFSGPCPLYPRKRTFAAQTVMSALGQKRTSRRLGYSITSSALASKVGATVSPSTLAVLRLMTSSYLVGACTGSSAGFSPLRMRST
jgi:hypothetical protein